MHFTEKECGLCVCVCVCVCERERAREREKSLRQPNIVQKTFTTLWSSKVIWAQKNIHSHTKKNKLIKNVEKKKKLFFLGDATRPDMKGHFYLNRVVCSSEVLSACLVNSFLSRGGVPNLIYALRQALMLCPELLRLKKLLKSSA